MNGMGTLYAIGEVLIDFIPQQKGMALKDVTGFERAPGGAPANVACAVAKWGANSSMITKLGADPFGDFLFEELEKAGVQTDKLLRTTEAHTGLAFVSLREDGERDFSFYRNPSADLLLHEDEIEPTWFTAGDILHFCSVDLVESPMKQAHSKAIQAAKQNGALISFDPNVRLPLWSSAKECQETIQAFLPLAHIVKIADEELAFITGIDRETEAISSLFTGEVRAVILTRGALGAELHLQDTTYLSSGFQVEVQDTTGAGDAFIGGFLYQLLTRGCRQETLETILHEHPIDILRFANASGALTTTGKGAISSLPTMEAIQELLSQNN